jgi:NAD(P)H-dependent FMN reductase
MSSPTLQIVVGSVREGRVGLPVAQWVQAQAAEHGHFAVELVDLAEVGLPLLVEPKHPILGDYRYQYTKDWSATVQRADAFVFVSPEYNHSFSAALKNAIDHLSAEWRYKPVGFVSYGGVAAGTRGVAMLKPVCSVLKMVPITEGVPLPFVHRQLVEGVFQDDDRLRVAATAMFDELARVSHALAPLRTPVG